MPLSFRAGRAALSRLTRTTNVPLVTSFTACGVSKINVDRGAGVNQSIFAAVQTPGTSLDVFLGWDNTSVAGSMILGSLGTGAGTAVFFASRPALGRWFEWYVRCSGTGANLLTAGWRNAPGTWVTASATLDTGAGITQMILSANGLGDYSDISFSTYREYSRVLTTPETEQELSYATPFNGGDCTNALAVPSSADRALFNRKGAAASTRWPDYSGYGNEWTEAAGGFDIEPGASIQFAPTRYRRRVRRTRPAAAGGTNVATGVGALTVTGFAPTVGLSANQNVAAGLGVLTATGFAPTAATSANQNVATALGTLTVTGLAPQVVVGIKVAAGVGAVTLTGFAPTVTATANVNVLTGAGAATLTGFAPSLTQNITVLPGVGAVTATGFAPTIAVPRNVTTGLGQITVTGLAPVVATPRNVTAGVGALTLTGFAPTIATSANRVVLPGVGQLTATGFAPTATTTANQSLTCGVGLLVATGYAPTVLASVTRAEEAKWLLFSRHGARFIRRSR